MRKQRLNKQRLINCLFSLALLCHGIPSIALSTDGEQDIEVLADTADLDDIKNISIYRGNVIVTQGSIRMTGDIMTVYHTEQDELDTLIMDGRPATYRQLPDDSTVYDEAEALRIEYYELKNFVILIKEAEVRQEDSIMIGDRIEYDTVLSQAKATKAKGTIKGPDTPKGSDRVKIIIKKKKADKESTKQKQ